MNIFCVAYHRAMFKLMMKINIFSLKYTSMHTKLFSYLYCCRNLVHTTSKQHNSTTRPSVLTVGR